MFNHQSLNPAYAGSKDYSHFAIIHRTQWLNFPGAPESQAFTFNNKMSRKNLGFGLSGVNDKIGPLSINQVALDLAYHLPINDAFLAIGIKAGISNFDFNEIVTPHTKKLLVLLKKNEDLWDTTSEKSSLNYKITPLKLLK